MLLIAQFLLRCALSQLQLSVAVDWAHPDPYPLSRLGRLFALLSRPKRQPLLLLFQLAGASKVPDLGLNIGQALLSPNVERNVLFVGNRALPGPKPQLLGGLFAEHVSGHLLLAGGEREAELGLLVTLEVNAFANASKLLIYNGLHRLVYLHFLHRALGLACDLGRRAHFKFESFVA